MPKIHDLRKLSKIPKHTFALDTNILYWTFYSRCYYARAYQKRYYPKFIEELINNGNKIIVTTSNLNELFHIIENNELKIYNASIGAKIKLKEFRKIKENRHFIKNELNLIYNQIAEIPKISIVQVSDEAKTLENFIDDYLNHCCDFYDFNLINYCNLQNYYIVSDDCDFVNGCLKTELFTACKRALSIA